MRYLLLALVTISGATIPIQIAANKRLFEAVKSPVMAVALVLSAGAVLAWIISLTIPQARGELSGAADAPWWAWLAVVMIVFAIIIQIINAKQEGAGPLLALIVAGQLVCALVIDHLGALGMEREPIRWWKIVGVVAMAAGAAVMQIKGN
jgi:transporter family-2 protein